MVWQRKELLECLISSFPCCKNWTFGTWYADEHCLLAILWRRYCMSWYCLLITLTIVLLIERVKKWKFCFDTFLMKAYDLFNLFLLPLPWIYHPLSLFFFVHTFNYYFLISSVGALVPSAISGLHTVHELTYMHVIWLKTTSLLQKLVMLCIIR